MGSRARLWSLMLAQKAYSVRRIPTLKFLVILLLLLLFYIAILVVLFFASPNILNEREKVVSISIEFPEFCSMYNTKQNIDIY